MPLLWSSSPTSLPNLWVSKSLRPWSRQPLARWVSRVFLVLSSDAVLAEEAVVEEVEAMPEEEAGRMLAPGLAMVVVASNRSRPPQIRVSPQRVAPTDSLWANPESLGVRSRREVDAVV